jgi:hypothetical protein
MSSGRLLVSMAPQVQQGDTELLAGGLGDPAAVEDLLLDQVLHKGLAALGGVGKGTLGPSPPR